MTKDEFNLKYWMFYMQLENDFSKTFNYVEFTDDNLSTYSKEYAKQLISIGSELDIVFKALCNEVDPTKARSCITDYANILCGYDNLTDATVQFSYNKESYKPFEGWTPNKKWGVSSNVWFTAEHATIFPTVS